MSDSAGSLGSSGTSELEAKLPAARKRLPNWLRFTRWRVLWLAGVIMFIWVTASIWLYRETLVEFSPETLEFRTKTRFVLLGTSLPIVSTPFDSSWQPDGHKSLLNFLMKEGYWTRQSKAIRWIPVCHKWTYGSTDNLVYRHIGFSAGDFHNTWINRGLRYGNTTGQCFWIEWSKEFPEEANVFWPSLLQQVRNSTDPQDRTLVQPLDKIASGLEDQVRSRLMFMAIFKEGSWKRGTAFRGRNLSIEF